MRIVELTFRRGVFWKGNRTLKPATWAVFDYGNLQTTRDREMTGVQWGDSLARSRSRVAAPTRPTLAHFQLQVQLNIATTSNAVAMLSLARGRRGRSALAQLLLLACLLLVGPVAASVGDQLPEFKECVEVRVFLGA